MDNLLVVPLRQGVPDRFLASLQQSGWRVTVTSDLVRAKQLLQKSGIAGLLMELSSLEHDPDRFKLLKFVHEFCPGILVMMLNGGPEALGAASHSLVKTLNTVDDYRSQAHPHAALDLYDLSPAQKRIALLVAQAYPNREIARQLKIKEQSVRNEVSRIFKKVGVWNRVELALLMREGQKQTGTRPESDVEPRNKRPWPSEFGPVADEKSRVPRTTAAI